MALSDHEGGTLSALPGHRNAGRKVHVDRGTWVGPRLGDDAEAARIAESYDRHQQQARVINKAAETGMDRTHLEQPPVPETVDVRAPGMPGYNADLMQRLAGFLAMERLDQHDAKIVARAIHIIAAS